nr:MULTISPECIES: hypothetical protein [Lysinibacillus]
MSKRARTSKIEKWIKEGRGTSVGSEYKPWLNIQDVASMSVLNPIIGWSLLSCNIATNLVPRYW